jgi:uncharacterized beta-barrel protein YwiB (DUF1934 family)
MKKKIWVQIKNEELQQIINSVANVSNNRIEFVDENNHLHRIIINEEGVRYQKKGNPEMDFHFAEDETEGVYLIDHQTLIFTIKTLELSVKDDTINIHYQLYQGIELISNHDIRVVLNDFVEA